MRFFRFAFSCWLLGVSLIAHAQENTLAPYFYIPDGNPDIDALPLQSSTAKVNIAGVIADVRITQCYRNDGEKPLEAIYVFPGSTQAAVYDMTMKVGNRQIKAKIQEKRKARRTYERAKKSGRSASLLEQHRPNVFQMNVANILPGDVIEVEIAYTELLQAERGTYSFVYPTVVGPRYGGDPQNMAQTHNWIEQPYLLEGQTPSYAFDLQISLNGGLPVRRLRSPSHQITTKYQQLSRVDIQLDPEEASAGDRDFILEYQLVGRQIEEGVLLWEGAKENFFLTLVQPPKVPQKKDLSPREYIFLLDVSGSMRGQPLELAKGVLMDLFETMSPRDYFNIVFFEGKSQQLSEGSLPATPANLQKAISMIDGQKGRGGTEMLSAIKKAMRIPKQIGTSRSFAIVTDGYISVEQEVFSYIRQQLGNANFFALGIGSSVNRHLIEGIAHIAMSESFVATKKEDRSSIAKRFAEYIKSPVLTDIHVKFEGLEVYDVIPKQIPDLLAERPIVIFGKYKGKAKGKMTLTGRQHQRKKERTISLTKAMSQTTNSALPFLWARHKIKSLDDFGQVFRQQEEQQEMITALGLEYGLLTRFTSFVAVDTVIRNEQGTSTPVKQPLPLPKNVPNSAIGKPGVSQSARGHEEDKPEFIDLSVEEEVTITPPMTAEPPPPPANSMAAEIFRVVEEMPYLRSCANGDKADRQSCTGQTILNFFHQNLKWPAILQNSSVAGLSVVQFVIGKDGKVKSAKVIRSLHPDLDKELLRVAQLLPEFVPGRQLGRKVEVQYNLPIRIRLH
ncbi:MAG: energy transducer TonB [Saprospiraceae bacterium]|nr:energy transducer TonB [Saprospiraceae bacterium]